MTLAVWSIWNGRRQLRFTEILAVGDRATVALIAGYLVAASHGDQTVNAWLAAMRQAANSIE